MTEKQKKEAFSKNVKEVFCKSVRKYWNINYFEGDTITYKKQEDGKVIEKTGLVKEIILKESHEGKKINRYYIVLDKESREYAVHEDSAIDGIYSDKRKAMLSEIDNNK